MIWPSENKKKPPSKILIMADTGIILFICINSFTILIILFTILDAIALKQVMEYMIFSITNGIGITNNYLFYNGIFYLSCFYR